MSGMSEEVEATLTLTLTSTLALTLILALTPTLTPILTLTPVLTLIIIPTLGFEIRKSLNTEPLPVTLHASPS